MESETVNIKGRRYEAEITNGKMIAGEFKFALDITDDQGNKIDQKENRSFFEMVAAHPRSFHKEYVTPARYAFRPDSVNRKRELVLDAILSGETFLPKFEEE